jgi:RNA polymerase sigma-70 factor (ECF subfamily)
MQLRAEKTKAEKIKVLTHHGLSAELVGEAENAPLLLEAKIETLEEGLAQIPAEQRQCVELFYLHQKSYKEIADITGYDLNKIKSYIQNGKRNLKKYLEKRRYD